MPGVFQQTMKKIVFLAIINLLASKAEVTGKADKRILNGELATDGQFPFMVLLLIADPSIATTCSGALIRKDLILTAAHCLANVTNAKNVIAGAGAADTNDWVKKRQTVAWHTDMEYPSKILQQRRGQEAYVHPKYNENKTYDLALLKVNKPFKITKFVGTIKYTKDVIKPGMKCSVHEHGEMSTDGPETQLIYFETNKLESDHSHCGQTEQIGDLYCKQKDNQRNCKGNSGGPLMCNNLIYGVSHKGSYGQGINKTCDNEKTEWFVALSIESKQPFLSRYVRPFGEKGFYDLIYNCGSLLKINDCFFMITLITFVTYINHLFSFLPFK